MLQLLTRLKKVKVPVSDVGCELKTLSLESTNAVPHLMTHNSFPLNKKQRLRNKILPFSVAFNNLVRH